MAASLKDILLKFSYQELLGVFAKLGYFKKSLRSWQNIPTERIGDVIDHILVFCEKDNITQDVTEMLELILVISRQSSYLWQVFELHEKYRKDEKYINPDSVVENILRKLRLLYEANIQYRLENGALWIRIYILNPLTKNTTLLYVAHYLHSSALIATVLTGNETEIILTAVARSLYFEKCVEIDLKGRCVKSLMQLVSERGNPGFQIEHCFRNPITSLQMPKDSDPVFEKNEDNERTRRSKYIKKTFGSCCQPQLPFVEYELQTKFHGEPEFFPRKSPLKCKVIFEGDSVLDGFCEMVESGVAVYPLPEHLENVRLNGLNTIKLYSNK